MAEAIAGGLLRRIEQARQPKSYAEILGLNEKQAETPLPVLARRADGWKPWIEDSAGKPVSVRPNVREGVVLVMKSRAGKETAYAMIVAPDMAIVKALGGRIFVNEITPQQYVGLGDDVLIVVLHAAEKKA